MSRRENFYRTLKHQKTDGLIIDLGGNPTSTMDGYSMYKLMDFLGYPYQEKQRTEKFGQTRKIDERILKFFDIDTRAVGSIIVPKKSLFERISDSEYIDEWGIRRVYTGMYWDITSYPLKGASRDDLKSFPWPEPDSIDIKIIEDIAKNAKKMNEETDYIVTAEQPVYGIFELGCWMCGFDDFLLKMSLDDSFVKTFFDIILEYQNKVSEIYYGSLGNSIHYASSGDDFGTQTSLFMSPAMFRELIKPYFKERIKHLKKFTNAAFLHHSCGSVNLLIEDFIDCGVEILNPIQPKATNMEPQKLKREYGEKIVFHGGIDTQDILINGSKETIYETVEKTIKILGNNGGYILAAAHNIQDDVPPENVVHMYEAAKKYGGRSV